MTALAKVKRVFAEPRDAALLGHHAKRLVDSIGRRCAQLDSQPLTVGAFLRGDYRVDLGVADAEGVLAEIGDVLRGGDASFVMEGDKHWLAAWHEQLQGAIARAKTYGGAV